MKTARLIDKAQVAGAEIAVLGKGGGVEFGAGAGVARRHVASDFERPDCAGWQRPPTLRVDNAQPDAGERWALSFHTPVERPVARRHAAIAVDFGRAVD